MFYCFFSIQMSDFIFKFNTLAEKQQIYAPLYSTGMYCRDNLSICSMIYTIENN